VNVFIEEAVENFDEKCNKDKEVNNTNSDKSTFNWEATAAGMRSSFLSLAPAHTAAAHIFWS